LFLTQSAAFSLEANAASALSNMLMVIKCRGGRQADNNL
jgi:hypothetical protein